VCTWCQMARVVVSRRGLCGQCLTGVLGVTVLMWVDLCGDAGVRVRASIWCPYVSLVWALVSQKTTDYKQV